MSIYLSTAYLGCIHYYSQFLRNENVCIESCENYLKQSYRNRCHILSSNGVISLSIPIESTKGLKMPIRDVKIADHDNWQHLHWNALISAYNSTPFFEYYRDYFEPFYHTKFSYLFDFNERLRLLIFDLLNLENENVVYTEKFVKNFDETDCDLRYLISPKVEFYDDYFNAQPYYQVFDNKYGFMKNLSIVDLLFNMGNESVICLINSYKKGL